MAERALLKGWGRLWPRPRVPVVPVIRLIGVIGGAPSLRGGGLTLNGINPALERAFKTR
ncbi:MAG: hypothetical protein K0S96_257, partial [Geminicoccaceae bacterium]|nr:hypothetical protein [Geminicoccaceae bacterium]